MVTNRGAGTRLGVKSMISSSTASKKAMMTTRTFTSHASHDLSLNLVSSILLTRHLCDHREQRQVQRDHDAAYHDAEDADHDRLHQGEQVLGGSVHFVFVEIGDFLEHGIHGACGLAHADHLGHHVGEDSAFL